MSERVSDEFLRQWATRYRAAPRDPEAQVHAAAYEELLERRAIGQTPEEFVERMAARVAEVEPTHTANFLEQLAMIAKGVRRIREIEAHSMRVGGSHG